MTAVMVGLAAVEYNAGTQAGWPWWRAAGVPLAFDAYAVKTLWDRAAKWYDVAFALFLILAAGALSVFHPPETWTSAGLVAVLVAVLWRHGDQRRRKRLTHDLVAEMGERLRHAREDLAAVRRELVAARDAVDSAVAAAVAQVRRQHERELADLRRHLPDDPGDATGEGSGDGASGSSDAIADLDPPPIAGTVGEQVEWVRRLLTRHPRMTWRDVAQYLQVEPRAAQHRMTHARRPLRSVDEQSAGVAR